MSRVFGLFTGALSFAYLIFVLNTIQMMTLFIRPFLPAVSRRINRWCARSIWGLWVIMGERQHGCEVVFRGDRVPWRENALVLPNHQSMADVEMLLSFAWRCGRIGDMKWFVKDVIKYVPGPGWGMWLLDCIFLRRDWMKDKQGILRTFEKYKKHQIPLFLVSFLEGTRRTPEKLAQSQRFAESRGMYVPQHTLVPRTKGFVATMYGLRDYLDAVYDVTLAYPGRIPTLMDLFMGTVPRVEIHVRRFAIEEMPEGEDALQAWAVERFRIKDEMMARFAETGELEGPRTFGPIDASDWLRSENRAPVRE